MSTFGFPPLSTQGNLNRVLTHVVIPGFPQLSVSAPFMAKTMATVTFDGPFVDQIPTATGVVNSPAPYVMAQVIFNILRSQAIAAAWMTQLQVQSVLGAVTIFSDATTFPEITLLNASVIEVTPGPFDGTDPTTQITVKGVFPINAALWAGALAQA
jgi:hypothetical protein